MPTYDYRCQSCGHVVEIFHSILDDGPESCERCRGPVERVLHPAGVIFKGSGFYKTDSRPAPSSTTTDGSGSKSSAVSGEKTEAGS